MEAPKATEFKCEDSDGNKFLIEIYLGPTIARLCAAAKYNGGESSIHMGHIKATHLKERKSGKSKGREKK